MAIEVALIATGRSPLAAPDSSVLQRAASSAPRGADWVGPQAVSYPISLREPRSPTLRLALKATQAFPPLAASVSSAPDGRSEVASSGSTTVRASRPSIYTLTSRTLPADSRLSLEARVALR